MIRAIIDLLFIGLIIAAIVVYFWQKKNRDVRQKLRDQFEDMFRDYQVK